jgi:outer membrane usher protein
MRELGASQRLEARTTIRLSSRAWFLVSAALTRDASLGNGGEVFAQLVFAGPDGGTFDAGIRGDRTSSGATTGAQRGLPPGTGYGYRVRADSTGNGTFSALAQAQPTFGRYEVGYDRNGTTDVASATAAGALVLVGGRLFATRPVEQGFALVRVPGVEGVRASLDHRPVGRTDANGDLLVPGLLAHYGNKLSIEDADVPPAYRVGETERVVAAPTRGATVVRFDVAKLRAVEGWLTIRGPNGPVVPAFGTFEVDAPAGPTHSPIAEDGNFWLEDLPAGTHAARIYWHGDVCELKLVVPDATAGVLELGDITCAPSKGI